jgi:hypothetical protein
MRPKDEIIAAVGAVPANACRVPTPAPRREAEIYRKFREIIVRSHCADGRPAHRCAGQITITRDAITMSCPRCGDLRKTIETSKPR